MDLIIWGGTGNFKVVREIAIAAGHSIVALFDNNSQAMSPFAEIPKVGGLSELPNWWNQRKGKQTGYVVTFGGGLGRDRVDIINQLDALGLSAVPMLHSRAYVSESARLHPSSQVYAMAAICTEAVIGKGCLINTGASVDHESELGEGVFIGPGARLAGLVKVDRFADIYTGAIILPRVHIGEGAVVGAGSVVRKHVPPYTMVAGNPARVIKEIPVP